MVWTVRKKLLGTFTVVLLAVIALGYISLANMSKINDNGKEVTNNWLWGIERISLIKSETNEFLNNYYQSLMAFDPTQKKTLNDQMQQIIKKIDGDIQSYSTTVSGNEDRKNYEELKATWDKFNQANGIATKDPQSAEGKQASKEAEAAFAAMQKVTATMVEFNHKGAEQSVVDSENVFHSGASFVFYLGAALVLFLIALSWMLIRNITIPLYAATGAMNRISAGDLSMDRIEVKRKDEFGILLEALNGTVSHLRNSVRQMQDSAGMVASSAEQLNASSEQNAGAAQQVADSIMQVATNSENQATTANECDRVMEEMAEGVQRIAETTADVADLSEHAAASAKQGASQIQTASDKMTILQQSIRDAGEKIAQLEVQSHQIGEISGLICDISAQTHLLALNAAIEAARAGEHGAGFAVVAGEVRKLSSQTDESVQGITQLIASIRTHVRLAADMMQTGMNEVQASHTAVQEAQEAFGTIVDHSAEVSIRVQEAAAAAEELAASSQQVAASVANMGNMASLTASMSQQVAAATEEQLASSEEIASSSQMLSQVAEELQDMVKTFKL